MSDTWRNRDRVRRARRAIRAFQRIDVSNARRKRGCCASDSQGPHDATCSRGARTCGQKVAFVSKAAAETRIAQIEALRGRRMGAYRCPFCRQWHLTRQLR